MITLNKETIAEISAALKELDGNNQKTSISICSGGVHAFDTDFLCGSCAATTEEAIEKLNAKRAEKRAEEIGGLKARLARLEEER